MKKTVLRALLLIAIEIIVVIFDFKPGIHDTSFASLFLNDGAFLLSESGT
jgi:hypothetical protein